MHIYVFLDLDLMIIMAVLQCEIFNDSFILIFLLHVNDFDETIVLLTGMLFESFS